MKEKTSVLLLIAVVLFVQFGCSSISEQKMNIINFTGRYDTGFPFTDASEQLDDIGHSIQRVSSLTFYNSYIFADTSRIKYTGITEEIIKKKSIQKGYFDKSITGTGIMIYSVGNRIGLLTCSHVVDLPDTVISFFRNKDGSPSEYLESISIKSDQTIYGAGFPGGGVLNLILNDKRTDIAFIGRNYSEPHPQLFQVFNYPLGDIKLLDWGSFVYVIGYPLNYKMITSGLVSLNSGDQYSSFLINSVINKGFSGGAVLAIKGGVPHFELVGILKSVPEEIENFIQPEDLKNNATYDPQIPYKGNLYVRQTGKMDYGIAKVIPINLIQKFLEQNQMVLRDNGYNIDKFFFTKTSKNE